MKSARQIFLVLLGVLVLSSGISRAQEQQRQQQGERAAAGAAAAAIIPPGTQAMRDIEYVKAGGKSRTLDLLVPPHEGPLPLVIWIHGGGWHRGDKTANPAALLLRFGYASASINYRLTDEGAFPAQINDCKAAVRWLRAHADDYGIDPDRIGVWGASAGGHLAALLGTAGDANELEGDEGNPEISSRVQAVCDFFGPADLTQVLDENAANRAVPKLLGGPLREKQETAKQASPLTYVSDDDPPFLIMHGTKDPLVDERQSELLRDALTKAHVEVTLEIIDGAGHGGPEFAAPQRRRMILEFFDKHLKSPKAKKQSSS
jgi:acetyl esterase/lipase